MERILAALLLATLATLAACASSEADRPAAEAPPAAPSSPRSDLSMAPVEVAFREELAAARAQGLPLLIQERAYVDGRFLVKFYNSSGEMIDELVFVLQPYDALGRQAGALATVRFRGPVRPSLSLAGDLLEGAEEGVWTGAGVDCVEITGLRLLQAGQAPRDYDFDTVTRMYREGVDKWCRFAD